MAEANDKKRTDEFVNLLVPNQRRIQAFILILVPNLNDAEDIYQDTLAEMWKQFDKYQAGTDFVAWAITIAKYKIFSFRRETIRSKVCFDEQVYNFLEPAAAAKARTLQDHLDVLKRCVQNLSKHEVLLLKMRYENEMTFQRISEQIGKTPAAIHRIMAGIHSRLALCVRRGLRAEQVL
ncbi:MAG TPA: sigma-70 family RNA polymerase sigma factor [Anaerohalosphaeraceae bacterium]|jgi:RNA polymerase sigma-70 factor (ECF subfamily)|nr:sigma-70 family RNA polymerase sigma factor [Anaerohalosphaeraceae bacterium]HQI08530.1 sigma-70 family RNA polymerase sigma factor [Anaerohalosphaeraceae bacterium]HQJ68885.1 sigma-70 family RNA polymerase sigma factor [Anaerohalosphaeraceae bacterium]